MPLTLWVTWATHFQQNNKQQNEHKLFPHFLFQYYFVLMCLIISGWFKSKWNVQYRHLFHLYQAPSENTSLVRENSAATCGLSTFGIWLSTRGNPLAKATKADTNLLVQYLSEVKEYADEASRNRLKENKRKKPTLKKQEALVSKRNIFFWFSQSKVL